MSANISKSLYYLQGSVFFDPPDIITHLDQLTDTVPNMVFLNTPLKKSCNSSFPHCFSSELKRPVDLGFCNSKENCPQKLPTVMFFKSLAMWSSDDWDLFVKTWAQNVLRIYLFISNSMALILQYMHLKRKVIHNIVLRVIIICDKKW